MHKVATTRTRPGAVLVLVVLSLVLSACDGGTPAAAPTTTTTSTVPDGQDDPAGTCSAAGLSEDVPEPEGLPAPVAMMRKEILKAAVRCDYELLEQLALRGDGTFQYSYGQDSPHGSAEHWRSLEEQGEDVLATMVQLLALPHASEVTSGQDADQPLRIYSWPSAQVNQTDADWEALEAVYPPDQIAEWRSMGTYLGYRVGITDGGDWIYFVAGD